MLRDGADHTRLQVGDELAIIVKHVVAIGQSDIFTDGGSLGRAYDLPAVASGGRDGQRTVYSPDDNFAVAGERAAADGRFAGAAEHRRVIALCGQVSPGEGRRTEVVQRIAVACGDRAALQLCGAGVFNAGIALDGATVQGHTAVVNNGVTTQSRCRNRAAGDVQRTIHVVDSNAAHRRCRNHAALDVQRAAVLDGIGTLRDDRAAGDGQGTVVVYPVRLAGQRQGMLPACKGAGARPKVDVAVIAHIVQQGQGGAARPGSHRLGKVAVAGVVHHGHDLCTANTLALGIGGGVGNVGSAYAANGAGFVVGYAVLVVLVGRGVVFVGVLPDGAKSHHAGHQLFRGLKIKGLKHIVTLGQKDVRANGYHHIPGVPHFPAIAVSNNGQLAFGVLDLGFLAVKRAVGQRRSINIGREAGRLGIQLSVFYSQRTPIAYRRAFAVGDGAFLDHHHTLIFHRTSPVGI